MKVLVFTTLFPNNVWPNHGVFIRQRTSAVNRLNGCEMRVVAPVPYYPAVQIGWRQGYAQVAREEVIDGIPVYHPRYFMIPKMSAAFHGLLMFWSLVRFIRKIRTHFDFDIIDSHYVYPDGFAAVLLSRFFRKPVIVSARGSDINLLAQKPIIRKLVRYALARATHIITVSAALKSAVVGLGIPARKVSVVPNGVDPEKFYPIPKSKARKELGLPEHKRLLLSVGGLTPVKGFDLLIRAIKNLVQDLGQKDLLLKIVGEGQRREQLEESIAAFGLENHVGFVGAVPHTQLGLWYSAADLFCLASSREGWPNVVLESLACGTPVVATPVGGIPEIIRSKDIGILTARNESAMTQTIDSALRRTWNADEIVRHARTHKWSDAASRIGRIFETALSGIISESNVAKMSSEPVLSVENTRTHD